MITELLVLKRAHASRSSAQWRDDDYDVLENGVVVGRIFFLVLLASGHDGDIRRAARAKSDVQGGDGRRRA